MAIIFARPRWEYQSYWDLWQLVKVSGFPLVYFDEIDWGSDDTYIISPNNGEIPNPLPPRNCKVIWLNIERPSYDGNAWKFDRPDFDEIWITDVTWAKQVGARYFLMGGDSRTGGYEPEKEYDYVTNTYDNPRRVAIWDQLRDLKMAPNGWENREYRLSASRLAVVPQQDNPPHAVTPLRFTIAAAHRLPMVYEGETDTHPFTPGIHFIHSTYDCMAEAVREALANPYLQDIGDELHHRLCIQTDFKTEVERMFE